jgi:enoyl-CoA hydratase/carnithine racemase
MDLLLSARVVQGDEAAELGIISAALEADDLMPHVMAYARDLAANASPASMATIKHQINSEADMTAHDATDHAEGLMRESLAGPDVGEGIGSFLQKRPVSFPPLGGGTGFGWMRASATDRTARL